MGVPRFWREQPYRYNLEGTQCGSCQRVYFPPRTVCPDCRRASIGRMKPFQFRGEGTVVAATVVHSAAPGYEGQVPYCMAIVELDEGTRMTAQIADCVPQDVAPGTRVRAVFRRMHEDGAAGVIYYGTKFVPDGDLRDAEA